MKPITSLFVVLPAVAQLIGWDAYRSMDLYSLRPGEETHEFSSYDRQNHNDDGFEGTYSCLRQDKTGCVLAEYNGPGQISDIWFTYEPDSIQKAGDITIILDGKTVVSDSIQAIVNGQLGPPFVWPLVGNTNDTMGGNVIKVPMAFSKSMLVTTSNNPHFYHVVYRRFPPSVKVSTFDPHDTAEDVVAKHTRFGVEDPKPSTSRSVSHSHHASLTSGPVTLGHGCGIVSQLAIRIPSILPSAYVQDDGRAYAKGNGGSSFTMQLDPANSKCKMTRRIDKSIGHQNTWVVIDDQVVGYLNSETPSKDGKWLDQVIDIPSALTARKGTISIASHCSSSDLDCNEFFYALHCRSKSGKWDSASYIPSKDWVLMDVLNVGPNNPHDEQAHNYRIQGQTWQGLRDFEYDDAHHSSNPLPDVRMTLAFDGHKTVSNVPIGAVFGPSLSKSFTRSLLLNVDTLDVNGAWTTYFPMPFKHGAKLQLHTGDGHPVEATVDWTIQQCRGASPSKSRWGYFRTQYRRGDTTPGQLWPILSAKGPGVSYGVTQTVRAAIEQPANTLEFLEGDEQVWLNRTTPGQINDTSATMLGTGTEDFYESGWYYQDFNSPGMPVVVPYAMPMTGLTASGYKILGCKGSCVSMHRQMMADSQAFPEDGISFNIEHGPDGNNIQANYETCAYYYA